MPGKIRSAYSTTVTLEPSRCQTDPSSSPITPAPMTTKCPGTEGYDSASVLVPMRSPSSSTPGNLATLLPVAMSAFLVVSSTDLP
jgi:hypothetical protein